MTSVMGEHNNQNSFETDSSVSGKLNMSKRSYTSCYLHLIWGVKERKPLLSSKESRKAVNHYFQKYLKELNINCKVLHSNPDHIHILIELPTNRTIEEIVKLLKGSSSHWINQNNIIKTKFAWAVGYAAFTVSESNVPRVFRYILKQEEHHKAKTFTEEYDRIIKEYGKDKELSNKTD